jgi:probable HAF family extracellular repeat protein
MAWSAIKERLLDGPVIALAFAVPITGKNKVMTDLNSLIPADSKLYLAFAFGINDDGDIVGQAIEKSSGEVHAFLATPRFGDVNDQSEATDTQNGSSERAALSENVRGLLQQRVRLGGFGSRFLGIR